jgi:hypothetical protein
MRERAAPAQNSNGCNIMRPARRPTATRRRARLRCPRSPSGRIDQLALLPLGQLILTTLSRESICRAKSCRADRCRRMAHALRRRGPDSLRAAGHIHRRAGNAGCPSPAATARARHTRRNSRAPSRRDRPRSDDPAPRIAAAAMVDRKVIVFSPREP